MATEDENSVSRTRKSRMEEIYDSYPRPKKGEHKALALAEIERAMLRLVRVNPGFSEDSAFDFLLHQTQDYARSAEVLDKIELGEPEKIPMAKNWFSGGCYDNECLYS